jgi:hypothetical protein
MPEVQPAPAAAAPAASTDAGAATTQVPATAGATTPQPSGSSDASAPSPTLVEDAMSAAEGTRAAAKWIASSLGAIPGLTVIASIVRAPGDAGFDATDLTLGIFLAAAGALAGILAFANVMTPSALEEKDLENIDVKRLPGHPFSSYRELSESLETLWWLKAEKDFEVARAKATAAGAEATSAAAEAHVLQLKSSLENAKDEEKKKLTDELQAARSLAATLVAATTAHKAELAKLTVLAESLGEQVGRREAVRTNLYRLAGSDEVGNRYEFAAGISIFAVAAVAGGLIFLGLAPNPKSAASEPVSLVTLKPVAAGKKALGCEAGSVAALKVGGDEKTPKVVTFPSAACPTPKQLDFKTEEPEQLGTVVTP